MLQNELHELLLIKAAVPMFPPAPLSYQPPVRPCACTGRLLGLRAAARVLPRSATLPCHAVSRNALCLSDVYTRILLLLLAVSRSVD